jgi:hypothetical protein
MFDLESQIRGWRSDLAAAMGNVPEPLDELESHLRDDDRRISSAQMRSRRLKPRVPSLAKRDAWRRNSPRPAIAGGFRDGLRSVLSRPSCS